MNKYIFFRTDRIGDFLMSSILFKSIKNSDNTSVIIVVASKKNFEYIKKAEFVDEVILFPESFTKKFLFYLKFFFKKFYLVGILDGKKRSIYFSLIVRSKYKFLFTYKKFYSLVFKYLFSKIFLDKNCSSKFDEIKNLLKYIGILFSENDLNTISYNRVNNYTLNISYLKKFILIHFDEKWIFNDYINSYKSIEPLNEKILLEFLEKIVLNSGMDLVVSTGSKSNKYIDFIKKKFSFLNKNIYFYNSFGNKIYLYDNLSFSQLEKLILNSDTLITCHGAPSHVGAALNKKIIDIIDLSEDDFFLKWTAHFRSHNLVYRDGFINISKKILSLL
jgi:ADP-heptose:LPS heptosyltransferase